MTIFNNTSPQGKSPTANSSPVRPSIHVSRKPGHGKRFQVQVLSTKGASTSQSYFSRGTALLDLSMLPFGKISHVVVREIKRSDLERAASSLKGETLINIRFNPPAEHQTVRSCKFQLANGELSLRQKGAQEKVVMKKLPIPQMTSKAGKSQRVFERTTTYQVLPSSL